MHSKRNLGFASLALCGLLASSLADATTWTYSSTGPVTSGGLSATASGFSATNNSSATINATTAYYSGGLGVTSSGETTTSPQHAVDNNGAIESVLIGFSNGVGGITSADRVNLTQVRFGYAYLDSDFSVYAYTGSAATPTPLGLTYSNLTSNGWSLIGHYNGGSSANTYNLNTSVYSSHWLIGAYNGLGSGLDKGNDYFKLASVTGNPCPSSGTIPAGCGGNPPPPPQNNVPEPATWLLIGTGLMGLTRMRRQQA